MMPFSPPEKLTAEEEQFLRDNKNSALVKIFKKALQVVAEEFEHKENLYSENITPERMLIVKGFRNGLSSVYNFIEFYCQEKHEMPASKRPVRPIR